MVTVPKLTEPEIEEFLAGVRGCRIGSIDVDGFPYVVPCSYLFEDGVFYVAARARAAWGEHLERDGRCFLCIDAVREGDVDQWMKRVLVKGRAELLDGPRSYYRRDDPMAQRGFRIWRRYWPRETIDDDIWRAIEGQRDIGFRQFRIQPLKIITWRGREYAARYRNVYTDE
jgi:hypothetical protein